MQTSPEAIYTTKPNLSLALSALLLALVVHTVPAHASMGDLNNADDFYSDDDDSTPGDDDDSTPGDDDDSYYDDDDTVGDDDDSYYDDDDTVGDDDDSYYDDNSYYADSYYGESDSSPSETVSESVTTDSGAGPIGNAITISEELYDALFGEGEDVALSDIDLPEADEVLAQLEEGIATDNAATLECNQATVPMNDYGCAKISAKMLISTGALEELLSAPQKMSKLHNPSLSPKLFVDSPLLCEAGEHQVTVAATDAQGFTKSCTTNVSVCDPYDSESECDDFPVIEEPPTPTVSTCTPVCRWLKTKRSNPAESNIIKNTAHAFTANGVGPWHKLQGTDGVSTKNCEAEDVEETATQSGDVVLNANVLCFDKDNPNQLCSTECESTVEIHGLYRSSVSAESETNWCAPWVPPFVWNSVEALAQDEADFQVNGATLFNKAAIIQNGNDLSTTVSLKLGGELSNSKAGLSAKIGANIGVSFTETDNTVPAGKADLLNAFGTTTVSTPMTARMSSEGQMHMKAHGRVWAEAVTQTKHWGVYWMGQSACPGAGSVADGQFYGLDTTEQTNDKKAANDFFYARGSDTRFETIP